MDEPQLQGLDVPNYHANTTEPPPLTPRQRAFERLLKVSPQLKTFLKASYNGQDPPPSLNDSLYLTLCATLADPLKREILRALILDLIADDLGDIIVGFLADDK